MTYKEKEKIRKRDRYWYNKLHGAIPEGYTMHHNYYNELWYDEDAFIIITKEEHDWIHGKNMKCSEGFDYVEHNREYYANNRERISEYRKAYREEIKEYNANYYNANKDKIKAYREQNRERRNEQSRIYNAKVKAVRMSNGLTKKQWDALTTDDRKRLRDAFEQNVGNT